MSLFSLLISSVNRELVFAVNSIHHPWLNFQRWFLVLQWLSFRWRFMDQHWHSVFDNSMPQTWIYFFHRFYASLVNCLTLSTPYVSCHSYFSGDFKVTNHFFSLTISGRLGRSLQWRFHASTMTLFSLMISFVNRELVFAVHSIRQPWLNFRRLFLVLQWLSFHSRFMDQHWHSVFDDSMSQTWIFFFYRFYASLVNSLTMSTPYISCHSYFSGDFKVYGDSVFTDDFW